MIRRCFVLLRLTDKSKLLSVAKKNFQKSWNTKNRQALLNVAPLFATSVATFAFLKSSGLQRLENHDATEKLHRNRKFIRFLEFGSIQVNNEPCLTPRDFLDSLIQTRARPRIKQKVFSKNEIQRCVAEVDQVSSPEMSAMMASPSPMIFRKLGDTGIITYTEYLFLLSLLTRPRHAFKIAFDVIDTSGEGEIVREEFAKFCQCAVGGHREKNIQFKVQESGPVETSLVALLFGKDGNSCLTFENFSAFVTALQREVLMTEFLEYSLGNERMSERDLALFLLRFLQLQPEELQVFYDRLDESMSHKKQIGITFEDLTLVTRLINNLEDFCVIASFYQLAGKSLSKDEFSRAAKICLDGDELSPHLVDTMICIFDACGNERIDYKEFVEVMTSRKNRRLVSTKSSCGWKNFKRCVRREMIEQQRTKNFI